MNKPITDIDDPRLVKALAHPLRVRILALLERGPATPKQVAAALGAPLENLSYHVRTLRDFGFIDLEERRMVRGAVEHQYRLGHRPRITAKAWESLPEIVREALDAASLGQIWDVVSQAALQGKMDRPESHVARQYARLDEQGFAEASALVTELLDRLAEIEQASAERLRAHETVEVPATLIAMLFDAPDAVAPEDGRADGSHRSTRSTGEVALAGDAARGASHRQHAAR
jgi:DNA-binding transcriptional ArsR family regulator